MLIGNGRVQILTEMDLFKHCAINESKAKL